MLCCVIVMLCGTMANAMSSRYAGDTGLYHSGYSTTVRTDDADRIYTHAAEIMRSEYRTKQTPYDTSGKKPTYDEVKLPKEITAVTPTAEALAMLPRGYNPSNAICVGGSIFVCNLYSLPELPKKYKYREFEIVIQRPTIFGNPYRMESKQDRTYVCESYEAYFYEQLKRNSSFKQAIDELVELYTTYKVLILYCCCAPRRCHGVTIANYILQRVTH